MALPAPNTVATAAVKPVQTQKADNKTKSDAFKAQGAAIRASLSEEELALECSKSDQVAFITCLTDPTKKGNRSQGSAQVPAYAVVGYKFRILADMEVPKIPIINEDPYNCNTSITWEPVKAGDIVNLTVCEAMALATLPEYGGLFSGEGQEVKLSIKISGSNNGLPRPLLKRTGVAIREDAEFIATMENGDGGSRKVPVVKEEYVEKFSPLYAKRVAKRGAGKKKTDVAHKNLSAAFRQLLAEKQA